MGEAPGVRLVRNDALFHAQIGADTTVMLDTEAGQYFGLNAVGTYIWEMLERPRSVPELCAAVCAEFDVDAATCDADVPAFLRRLIDNGILRETDA